MAGVRCDACGERIQGMAAHHDWDGGLCDDCWRLTSRITRGWLAITVRNAEEAGWSERYTQEYNVTFDVLTSQARQALKPAPARKAHDERRVLIDMGKAGRPRGGYGAQLQRDRNRGRR